MRVLAFALAVVMVAAAPAAAVRLDAAAPDCEALATEAGLRAGLPEGLLPAIARIESGRVQGRTLRAWPWTLNHAGRGLYFDTRSEALEYLRRATRDGRTNIDVGCMQINHRWHGDAFADLSAMLDPATNVAYAVRFLAELRARHGSWAEAVRHYHSPDPERGARYLERFSSARAHILARPVPPTAAAPPGHLPGGFAGVDLATLAPSASAASPPGAAFAAWPRDRAGAGTLIGQGLGGGIALGRAGLFGATASTGGLLVGAEGRAVLAQPNETEAIYAALIALADARRPAAVRPVAEVAARDLSRLALPAATGRERLRLLDIPPGIGNDAGAQAVEATGSARVGAR
jgi:hypothetical protein